MKLLYFEWMIVVTIFEKCMLNIGTGKYTSFKRFPAGTVPME